MTIHTYHSRDAMHRVSTDTGDNDSGGKIYLWRDRKNGQTEQGQPKSAIRNQKSEIKLWL
jgi:hypothetical protein